MSFFEYVRSMQDDQRLKMLNNLSKYGDPNAILNDLANTFPCYFTKNYDIRVNERWLLWFEGKTFWFKGCCYLYKMESIAQCYFSESGDGIIGLVFDDNSRREFIMPERDAALAVYRNIQYYVHGFENIKPYDPAQRIPEVRLHCPYYTDGAYVFLDHAVYRLGKRLGGKYKEEIMIPDVRDVIWCKQNHQYDSEAPDTFALTLYLYTNRKTVDLELDSAENAYQFAVELKKRVPHLLYGPSEEYEGIYRRNPAELMALAQHKAYRQ